MPLPLLAKLVCWLSFVIYHPPSNYYLPMRCRGWWCCSLWTAHRSWRCVLCPQPHAALRLAACGTQAAAAEPPACSRRPLLYCVCACLFIHLSLLCVCVCLDCVVQGFASSSFLYNLLRWWTLLATSCCGHCWRRVCCQIAVAGDCWFGALCTLCCGGV